MSNDRLTKDDLEELAGRISILHGLVDGEPDRETLDLADRAVRELTDARERLEDLEKGCAFYVVLRPMKPDRHPELQDYAVRFEVHRGLPRDDRWAETLSLAAYSADEHEALDRVAGRILRESVWSPLVPEAQP